MYLLSTNKVAVSKPRIKIYLNHKNHIFPKIDTQMWKLQLKLNFPNIFKLTAIYTWTMALNG